MGKRDPADDLLDGLTSRYGGVSADDGGDPADALLSNLAASYGAPDDSPGFRMVPAGRRKPGPWADDYEGARPAPPASERGLMGRIGDGATRVAEGIGTAATDVLDTVTAGGYRRLRDAVGDRIAPESMDATRAAERRFKETPIIDAQLPIEMKGATGDFLFGEADADGKRRLRTTVGDVTEKAGYMLPVGAPGRAMEAGRNAYGAQRAATGIGRTVQAGKAGAAGGLTQGAAEATVRNVGEGRDLAGWLEEVAVNTGVGTLFGGGSQALSETAGAGAGAIRNGKSKGAEHIRALEADGAEIGVLGVKNAPSERYGVQATSEGRGELGERAARRLVDDLDTQDAALGQRYNTEDMPRALKAEGGRQLSVDRYVSRIDEALADPTSELMPAMRSKLETTRKILTGELEPTMDIYSSRSESASTGRAPVFVQRGGRKDVDGNAIGDEVAPRGRYLSEDGLDNVVEGRAVNVDADRIRVPLGDVRGRVGDEPNYVLTAEKMNKLRDILDDVSGMDSRETGVAKDKLPLFKLANELRARIGEDAPAIADANARYSADKTQIEKTRERMKTEDSESLGMQLASLGEEGNKSAGSRKVRLNELRDEFPLGGNLTREQVEREFNAPRALLAEENMAMGRRLPRIGTGGNNSRNWPVVARTAYPVLNKGSRALDRDPGAGIGRSAGEPPPVSQGFVAKLNMAREALAKGATKDPAIRAAIIGSIRDGWRAEQKKRAQRGLPPLAPLPEMLGGEGAARR